MNTRTALAALALAGAAASISPAAFAASTPKVTAVSLQPAPGMGKDVAALYFRTDHAIARKANGKSLDASTGLKKATEARRSAARRRVA